MRESRNGTRAGAGRTVVAAPGGSGRGARVADDEQVVAGRNEVLLVGRVAAAAEQRELPSGDLLVSWRIVVDRPPPSTPAPDGVRLPTVDTLACVAWSARVRRTALGLGPGDVVEVSGALRQRYWRAGERLSSRTEVEAVAVRRLARAPG